MYGHSKSGYAPDLFLVDYLDGEGWHSVAGHRARNILAVFYPHKAELNRRISSGEILSIHFGGFEARFVLAAKFATTPGGAARSAARTAPHGGGRKAA